jgi:hypothetical protein
MSCLGPPSINCPSVGTWHSVPILAEELVMSVQLHTIKLPPTSALSNSHSTCGCLVPDVKRCDNQGRKPFEQSQLCRPGGSSSGGLSLLVELPSTPRSHNTGGYSLADLVVACCIDALLTPRCILFRIPDGFQLTRLSGDAARLYGPFKL